MNAFFEACHIGNCWIVARQGPIPEAAKKDGLVLTCLEHTDSTFMTFLSTFYNPGLQVLLKDGSWVDVEVHPQCLVMNAGDALVKTTGQFKATTHMQGS